MKTLRPLKFGILLGVATILVACTGTVVFLSNNNNINAKTSNQNTKTGDNATTETITSNIIPDGDISTDTHVTPVDPDDSITSEN